MTLFTRHNHWQILLTLGFFWVTALQAQPARKPSLPIFLEQLDITAGKKVKLPVKQLRQQYRHRVWTPDLQTEIREKILTELRHRGFYFAAVNVGKRQVDSLARTADIEFTVKPGNPLYLNSVTVGNLDSLNGEIRDRLSERLSQFSHQLYTEELSREIFKRIVNVFENNGFPLARVNTDRFEFREGKKNRWLLDLTLRAFPGDSVGIAYLRFPGQQSNLTPYLTRTLHFHPGQRYEEQRITKYVQILRRQEFIKTVQTPQLAKDKKGHFFLNIPFEEAPSTSLDGIIGYIPPPANDPKAKGYFTGLINIGVRNLFGGGRKFQVYWQKQDRFSDEFRLAYREPFVLGLPFHAGVGLNRLVRDTTFIEWKYRLDIDLPLTDVLNAFVRLTSRSVTPDSLASRQLRLPRTGEFTTETGIRWDVRDNPKNPRKGMSLELAFSLGNQKNNGPSYLLKEDSLPGAVTIKRLRTDVEVYLPTFKRQLLANHLHWQAVDNSVAIIRSPDQIWFGGANSVRGFRESQFFGQQVVWVNTEYRFLLGPFARFFLFTDNAYFSRDFPDKVNQWLTSYGLGLRFPGPLGIVQVDFGLEKGTPFREGKLHFRVVNEF